MGVALSHILSILLWLYAKTSIIVCTLCSHYKRSNVILCLVDMRSVYSFVFCVGLIVLIVSISSGFFSCGPNRHSYCVDYSRPRKCILVGSLLLCHKYSYIYIYIYIYIYGGVDRSRWDDNPYVINDIHCRSTVVYWW